MRRCVKKRARVQEAMSDEKPEVDTSFRRHAAGSVQCKRCFKWVKSKADGTPGAHDKKKGGQTVPCRDEESGDAG